MTLQNMKDRFRQICHSNPGTVILTVLFILSVVFFLNNDFMYKRPIAKVISAKTIKSEPVTNHNNGMYPVTEKSYDQKLTLKLLNTEKRGKKIVVKHRYNYSQLDTEKLSRGDKVFVSYDSKGNLNSCHIIGVKRDSYAYILLALFIYIILLITGKRGGIIAFTTFINIGIFIVALELYDKGMDIMFLANVLILIFPCITLLLSNGFKKSTFMAILATYITLLLTLMLFKLAVTYGEEIDYANLDYIVGDHDLERIFFASIELAGLGVIMDVAVSITSALYELVQKTPDLKFKGLVKAGREMGYDIMGTMINVLLFTYICGLMPLIILKLRNDISLFTIIRLQIPFEICRFLFGSIQILAAIPVSIALSCTFIMKRRSK